MLSCELVSFFFLPFLMSFVIECLVCVILEVIKEGLVYEAFGHKKIQLF